MHEQPGGGSAVAETYPEAGTTLEYAGMSSIKTDGDGWRLVRNLRTAQAGWIRDSDIATAP